MDKVEDEDSILQLVHRKDDIANLDIITLVAELEDTDIARVSVLVSVCECVCVCVHAGTYICVSEVSLIYPEIII